MTILVTSDLHLNALPRDRYRHDFQKQLRAFVTKHQVSTVLILGDFTDDKNYHSGTLVNEIVDYIQQLAQMADVTLLKGNHDYASANEVAFFTFLGQLECVKWIGEPRLIGDLMFLPHATDPKREWAHLPMEGLDWIFAHQTFEGAKDDQGRPMGGPSTSIFPKGSRVVSGDVHGAQTVGPVTYVGSPYRIDFGDDFEPRVLLIKDNKLVSLPCTGPQKRLVEVRAGELPSTAGLSAGDILKVRVELAVGQYASWAALKDGILAWGAKMGYVVHLVQPIVKRNSTKKAVTRAAVKSDEELLKGYGARHRLDSTTVKVGLKLL